MASRYELYSQSARDRQWQFEAVLNSKSFAIEEARALVGKTGVLRVQVVEERIAGDGDLESSCVIFQATASAPKPQERDGSESRRQAPRNAPSPPHSRSAKTEGDFLRYLVLMALSLAGIGLATVGGILVLLPYLDVL